MSFVVDNSVALAWCFEAERTAPIMALLDRLEEGGAWAPALWPLEALNGLLSAERRGRIDGSTRWKLSGFLSQLPISIDGETAERVWASTAHIAEGQRLTAYDAAYLELAIRAGLPLATVDRGLAAAAVKLGVTVLPAVGA